MLRENTRGFLGAQASFPLCLHTSRRSGRARWLGAGEEPRTQNVYTGIQSHTRTYTQPPRCVATALKRSAQQNKTRDRTYALPRGYTDAFQQQPPKRVPILRPSLSKHSSPQGGSDGRSIKSAACVSLPVADRGPSSSHNSEVPPTLSELAGAHFTGRGRGAMRKYMAPPCGEEKHSYTSCNQRSITDRLRAQRREV